MDDPGFNPGALIGRLGKFPAALRAAVAIVDDDDARWKPQPQDWSILEIVNHLADEEVEDFRARLELTLRNAPPRWPPIDPVRAASERGYNERELSSSIERLVNERHESVRWLSALAAPDWSKTYVHETLGDIRAGDLLVSWAAHDALHLRQIARRLYDLAGRDGAGFSRSYAGEWNPRG